MIEPLLALTVLNCFFMLSSTVTTCALWWQYRTHRCCFARNSPTKSSKSNCSCGFPCKAGAGGRVSSTAVDRKSKRKKLLASQPHRVDFESRETRQEKKEKKERKDRKDRKQKKERQVSEGKETGSEDEPKNLRHARTPVLLEISTVRKVVQIMENEEDLPELSGAIEDLVSRRATPDKDNKQPRVVH